MKRGKKIGLAVAALGVLVLAGVAGAVAFDSARQTQAIEAVADRIVVPDTWVPNHRTLTPPRSLCIGKPCPSMYMTWETPGPVTVEVFQQILDRSGFGFTVEGSCERDNPNYSGPDTVCEANGVADGARLSFGVTDHDSPHGETQFSVMVTRDDAR